MTTRIMNRIQEIVFVRKGVKLVRDHIHYLDSQMSDCKIIPLRIDDTEVSLQIVRNLVELQNKDPNTLNYFFLLKEEDMNKTGQILIGWLGIPDLSNRSKLLYSISHGGEYCIDPETGYGVYDILTYPYMRNRYETTSREIPIYFCYAKLNSLEPMPFVSTLYIQDIYKNHKHHTLADKKDILHLYSTNEDPLLVFPI